MNSMHKIGNFHTACSRRSNSNPLNIDWDPAPSPEDGPPLSAGAIRDPAYLPAQIGGIVGSYAVCLILVAIGLLALAKKRREHLRAGEGIDDGELELPGFHLPVPSDFKTYEEFLQYQHYTQGGYQPQLELVIPQTQAGYQHDFPYPPETPRSPYRNFSYPDNITPISPIRSEYNNPNHIPSPGGSTIVAPGYDYSVDQSVIQQDREMAQQQLEDMYKYVMEQEEAKLQGRAYQPPTMPSASQEQLRPSTSGGEKLKKGKNKPTNLNLDRDDKAESRGSSIFSILKSPRKKSSKAMNISSPIMTPMSGTFPRYGEGEEMNTIPPRQYAPVPPPPVPTGHNPYLPQQRNTTMPLTPEMSPNAETSIDGRLGAVLSDPPPSRFDRPPQQYHSRDISGTTEADRYDNQPDPISASSEKSTTPLVGLPSSPKPGVNRFPSLPASPRPGQSFSNALPASPRPGVTFPAHLASPTQSTFPLASPVQQSFSRPNAPSAVRTGGALPLRAYEPSLASPRITNQQTVFTRAAGPLSPGLGTASAVPYSPYQPFSPVIPMTPSLVTKADRKRMKRMEPKTPTVEMVRSADDIW
ncbi:hypothetical protein DL546_004183 [Coniochaeta pulveracea]|uniref:Uncharacterized protein n=1 Tax=Coniochaeta pulveracea TaxID=177199 RepID=A0A420YMQ4_9PEZI|nr:hypothetical protein DL546_004183 [Coniochaeta pulveracea]